MDMIYFKRLSTLKYYTVTLFVILNWERYVQMTVALASAGDGGATFMAMLGKNGNSHAKWNKICDKFDRFCDRGGGALIASFIGLAFLLLITVLSIIKLLKHPKTTITALP